MNNSPRMNRIDEIIHRELAKLIRSECRDPRLGLVTVTTVKVSKDLSCAKVFITVLTVDANVQDSAESSLKILNNASGFLRSRLSQIIKLRKIPALRFVYDHSTSKSERMAALFSQLNNANNYHGELE